MKVIRLTIKNIGKIADEVIELNKPLILFYGEIMAGKTTILNAVKWCFGGAFPSDIIRHGATEAKVTLDFAGGSITREWYIAKDETTKARDIVFIRDGKPIKKPVQEIQKFLNPFLLDQDYLRNMTELERRKFFVDFLGVDTAELDTENSDLAEQARQLRAKVAGYGEIDLTEVKAVDVTALKSELAKLRGEYDQKWAAWEKECTAINTAYLTESQKAEAHNSQVREHNATVDRGNEKVKELDATIADLEKRLAEANTQKIKTANWLKENPKREEIARPVAPKKPNAPTPPDTSALDTKIQEAGATNVRAEQYQANLARAEQRKQDNALLLRCEERQREIKKAKAAKLAAIAATSKIEGLSFDEVGNFLFEGTQAGMLSTSQVMRLSAALSALYPEGFGVDLIDRGESLGKSIFDFVDKAKREDKTILATIVGEKPAKVPANVGVFVVENGEIRE